jgi:hypothetical protein
MSTSKPIVKLSLLHLAARLLAREHMRREAQDVADLGITGWPWRAVFYDSQSEEHIEAAFEFEDNVAKFAKDYHYDDYELWQRDRSGRLIKRATFVAGQYEVG